MRNFINDWTAMPTKLRVRVGTEPLSMARDYVWAHHTTNHYGQGAKWAWWNLNVDNDPTSEVFGEEAQNLLTSLVRQHKILGLLAIHYRIPEAVE